MSKRPSVIIFSINLATIWKSAIFLSEITHQNEKKMFSALLSAGYFQYKLTPNLSVFKTVFFFLPWPPFFVMVQNADRTIVKSYKPILLSLDSKCGTVLYTVWTFDENQSKIQNKHNEIQEVT